MTWNWKPDMRVLVYGLDNGVFTRDGSGVQAFDNLEAARLLYPDLDPDKHGKRFTCAMKGGAEGKVMIRFETWRACERYSR